jgi:pyocin large subunit-like protein
LSRNIKTAIALLLLLAVVASASGPGFRTQHLLDDHFARYGSQFGAISVQQYLQKAQQLRDANPGKNILVSKRPDGSGSKFDVKKGWFVSFDRDGTLLTFFIPKDGVRYFDRQQKSKMPPPE